MSFKSVEYPEKNVALMTVEVSRDVFQSACDKVFKRQAGRISVAGFRKGKAPRKIIEKVYGEGVFYEDAVNDTYSKAYDEAVQEAGLEADSKPEIEVLEVNADGYSFTAKFVVKPSVILGQYKGLSAPKPDTLVSDEEVEAEIMSQRRKISRLETVAEAAEKGDTVVMDFEGFKDGIAFEGGKAEHHTLELGSGRFIPGFEEQLIGLKADDESTVTVTFPEHYQAEELAGQEAVFNVKIHEVKRAVLPEADDEFAKDVSEFDTLDELKNDIRVTMQESRESMAKNAFEYAVLDALIDGIETDIPEMMIDQQVDNMMEDMEYRLRAQRIQMDMYWQMTGQTEETMRADIRPEALRQIKLRLALEAVAAAEGIEITDEEADAEYAAMAARYNAPEDRVRRQVPVESVKKDLLSERAVKLVTESATVSEPSAENSDGAEPQSEESVTEDTHESAEA